MVGAGGLVVEGGGVGVVTSVKPAVASMYVRKPSRLRVGPAESRGPARRRLRGVVATDQPVATKCGKVLQGVKKILLLLSSCYLKLFVGGAIAAGHTPWTANRYLARDACGQADAGLPVSAGRWALQPK